MKFCLKCGRVHVPRPCPKCGATMEEFVEGDELIYICWETHEHGGPIVGGTGPNGRALLEKLVAERRWKAHNLLKPEPVN